MELDRWMRPSSRLGGRSCQKPCCEQLESGFRYRARCTPRFSRKQKGLCQPTDVVVVSPRKWLRNSSLGEVETLCGFPLQDYCEDVRGAVTYIGAHRSKGMDFLAVILIDFEPFEYLAADPERLDLQEAFFLGASRARQLLAVVKTVDLDAS